MAAIVKSKMSAGYHGNLDGYLALYEFIYSKLAVY